MTQLELEISRGAYKASFFGEAIKSLFRALINARQKRANEEVARLLKKEFPNETHEYILQYVEKGRINELHK